jgi:hypothetical protein
LKDPFVSILKNFDSRAVCCVGGDVTIQLTIKCHKNDFNVIFSSQRKNRGRHPILRHETRDVDRLLRCDFLESGDSRQETRLIIGRCPGITSAPLRVVESVTRTDGCSANHRTAVLGRTRMNNFSGTVTSKSSL